MKNKVLELKGDELLEAYKAVFEKYRTTLINTPTSSSSDKLLERGCVFQFDEEITRPDVLFVGINPSYKHGMIKEELFYTQEAALNHAYFKPFEGIKNELKKNYKKEISWTHMDMLVFKETQQSYIKDHLFRSPQGLTFIKDQLSITKKILENKQPKVMVVSNTMARELLGRNKGVNKKTGETFGEWMGLEFTFDKELGTDVIINHASLNGTVVFFTSMLSGQRSLDNGSKERLIWHINRALSIS